MSAPDPFFPWPDGPDHDRPQRLTMTTAELHRFPSYTWLNAWSDGQSWTAHASSGGGLHEANGLTRRAAVRRALRALERSEDIR